MSLGFYPYIFSLTNANSQILSCPFRKRFCHFLCDPLSFILLLFYHLPRSSVGAIYLRFFFEDEAKVEKMVLFQRIRHSFKYFTLNLRKCSTRMNVCLPTALIRVFFNINMYRQWIFNKIAKIRTAYLHVYAKMQSMQYMCIDKGITIYCVL